MDEKAAVPKSDLVSSVKEQVRIITSDSASRMLKGTNSAPNLVAEVKISYLHVLHNTL